jgi:hypothetical protein
VMTGCLEAAKGTGGWIATRRHSFSLVLLTPGAIQTSSKER